MGVSIQAGCPAHITDFVEHWPGTKCIRRVSAIGWCSEFTLTITGIDVAIETVSMLGLSMAL